MKRLLPLVLLTAACASTSEYTPPADGRARALWAGNRVAVDLGGRTPSPACLSQLARVTHSKHLYLSNGEADVPPTLVVAPVSREPIRVKHGVVVLLALVALAALPVIDITLAAVPAEEQAESRDAIDQVHAFNDLLRTAGSPCAE